MPAIRKNGSLYTVLVYRSFNFEQDEIEAPNVAQRSVILAYMRRNEQMQHWFASSAAAAPTATGAGTVESSTALPDDDSTLPFHVSRSLGGGPYHQCQVHGLVARSRHWFPRDRTRGKYFGARDDWRCLMSRRK
jgi:hypothetical protein